MRTLWAPSIILRRCCYLSLVSSGGKGSRPPTVFIRVSCGHRIDLQDKHLRLSSASSLGLFPVCKDRQSIGAHEAAFPSKSTVPAAIPPRQLNFQPKKPVLCSPNTAHAQGSHDFAVRLIPSCTPVFCSQALAFYPLRTHPQQLPTMAPSSGPQTHTSPGACASRNQVISLSF